MTTLAGPLFLPLLLMLRFSPASITWPMMMEVMEDDNNDRHSAMEDDYDDGPSAMEDDYDSYLICPKVCLFFMLVYVTHSHGDDSLVTQTVLERTQHQDTVTQVVALPESFAALA